ncbi:unknown [Clostridium sp. CAG:921]|nr:unknown [Clostridium sp. CAG:921]
MTGYEQIKEDGFINTNTLVKILEDSKLLVSEKIGREKNI